MDEAALLNSVMVFLAPYVQKGAEGFASEAGKKCVEFLGKLRSLFQHDSKAKEIVAQFEREPVEYEGPLTEIVRQRIAQDADFTSRLEQLLAAASSEVRIDQKSRSGEKNIGVGTAKISNGKLTITQDAENTGTNIGIDNLEM